MSKIVKLSLFLMLTALFMAACGSGSSDSKSKKNVMPAGDLWLIDNADGFYSIVAYDDAYSDILEDSLSYSGGWFPGATLGDADMIGATDACTTRLPPGIPVTGNADAKCLLGSIVTTTQYCPEYTDFDTTITQYYWFYASDSIQAKGAYVDPDDGYTTTVDVSLKSGWNIVKTSRLASSGDQTISLVNSAPNGYRWVCYDLYN